MIKVFISYAHEDLEPAKRLYGQLHDVTGIVPWLDKECLLPGMKWLPAIRREIRESDFFISLMSRKSVSKKGYVQYEMNEALEILKQFPQDRIYLIPMRLDECDVPDVLAEIQYVDVFPNWNDGIARILSTIKSNPSLKLSPATREMLEEKRYSYKVGIVDLDIGLTKLSKVAQQLNNIQSFFQFTCPQLPSTRAAIQLFGGFPNLAVHEIPESFYKERQYLNVDLIACLTGHPLAFLEGSKILYNYFSGPSDEDKRFMFISTFQLDSFTKQAGCTFEKGITHLLVGQLVVFFTDLYYHDETRGCPLDFTQFRPDIVIGLKKGSFCSECYPRIQNIELKGALDIILANEMII